MRNYSPVVDNQFMFSKHQYTPIYTKNVNIKFQGHGNVTGIMSILLKKLQMDHCRCLAHYIGKLIVLVFFENIFAPPRIIPRNCFKYSKISTFQGCLD